MLVFLFQGHVKPSSLQLSHARLNLVGIIEGRTSKMRLWTRVRRNDAFGAPAQAVYIFNF